jgi:hypothetical protein
MKRRPLDGNARSLEPETQLGENIVNEPLIARVVCQPPQNVTVGMRGNSINVWRHVHVLLLRRRLDRRYMLGPRSTASTESAAISKVYLLSATTFSDGRAKADLNPEKTAAVTLHEVKR